MKIDIGERFGGDGVNDGYEVVWLDIGEKEVNEDESIDCDEEEKATN